MGEWRYRSTHSEFGTRLEMIGQLHVTTALLQGEYYWMGPGAKLDIVETRRFLVPAGICNAIPRFSST
jgi:hypothetical protein